MLIKNDIKHMNIDAEIKHIVESLNLIIKKIGCNNLLLNNKNTLEDIAFLEIYKNNEQLINADLLYVGERNNVFGEKISYVGMDVDMLLKIFNDILNNKIVAIVNTDTLFLEKANENKINFNIEVFKDYSEDFLKEVVKKYKNTNYNPSYCNLSEKSQEILNKYILHEDITSNYTREELKNFSMELPSRAVSKATIYNSITTNYIKGINKDLEKISD